MTTHAAILPARRPFGELSSSRWQALASVKNRQNALPAGFPSGIKSTYPSSIKPTLTSAVKRQHSPVTFDDEYDDGENVDPSITNPTKRAKNIEGTPPKGSSLVTTDAGTAVLPSLQPVSRVFDVYTEFTGAKRTVIAPASKLVPAGRSPKGKRVVALSKRRDLPASFVRINPPSSLKRKSRDALPFSIDAALSGTISSCTQISAAKPSSHHERMPASWFFQIYQDSPADEMANLMEHSACTLDISDDEAKKAAMDDRGKENIPPAELVVPLNAAARATGGLARPARYTAAPKMRITSSPDAMEDKDDDPRSPLSGLEASDFYPPGLDATSVEIVPADATSEPVAVEKMEELRAVAPSDRCSTPNAAQMPLGNAAIATKERDESASANIIEKRAELPAFEDLDDLPDYCHQRTADFVIWESDHGSGDEASHHSVKETKRSGGYQTSRSEHQHEKRWIGLDNAAGVKAI